MAKFMGTFGVRYHHEDHPSGKEVDPDGYVLIHATNMAEAIHLMQEEYGINYAFVYPDWEFKYGFHPNGVIATLGEEKVDPPGHLIRDVKARIATGNLPSLDFVKPVGHDGPHHHTRNPVSIEEE